MTEEENDDPLTIGYRPGQAEAFVSYFQALLSPAERETLKAWLGWLQKSQGGHVENVSLIPTVAKETELHYRLSKAWKDFLQTWERRN